MTSFRVKATRRPQGPEGQQPIRAFRPEWPVKAVLSRRTTSRRLVSVPLTEPSARCNAGHEATGGGQGGEATVTTATRAVVDSEDAGCVAPPLTSCCGSANKPTDETKPPGWRWPAGGAVSSLHHLLPKCLQARHRHPVSTSAATRPGTPGDGGSFDPPEQLLLAPMLA